MTKIPDSSKYARADRLVGALRDPSESRGGLSWSSSKIPTSQPSKFPFLQDPKERALFNLLVERYECFDLIAKGTDKFSSKDLDFFATLVAEFKQRLELAGEIQRQITTKEIEILMHRTERLFSAGAMVGPGRLAEVVKEYLLILFMSAENRILNNLVESYRRMEAARNDKNFKRTMERLHNIYRKYELVIDELLFVGRINGLREHIRESIRNHQSAVRNLFDNLGGSSMPWSSVNASRRVITKMERLYKQKAVARVLTEYLNISAILEDSIGKDEAIMSAVGREALTGERVRLIPISIY